MTTVMAGMFLLIDSASKSDRRQPGVIGHELEPLGRRAIETAQTDVRRVSDRSEASDTLADRGHETGMLDELGREIEKIDLVSCFCVDPL